MRNFIKTIILVVFIGLCFLVAIGCSKISSCEEKLSEEQISIPAQEIQPAKKISKINKPTKPEKQPEEQENLEKEVEVCFVGDVMMDSYIGNYIQEHGVNYPWSGVSKILNEADISVANLETSISTRGKTKKPKGYGFRSAPYTTEGLMNSGIGMVTIANNHILDFGQDALFDTMDTLKKYKIQYVGAGKNSAEAEKPIFIEKNGLKLGFIAYTNIIPYKEWCASENVPGIAWFKQQNHNHILENVKLASNECDLLIVVLHWGIEYSQKPEKWQVELAHQIIDCGADTIIGHHPHVLEGIEFYKNKPIFYSIGNFVFLKRNDLCGKTGIFKVIYNDEGYKSGNFYPVDIQYCKANLLTYENQKGNEITKMLSTLSQPFGTQIGNEGEILK